MRKSILERQFADVVRVSDAAEALCLVEQPQFIHSLGLVIASSPMQGIGGPAFVAELHARLPEVPILVLGDAALGDAVLGDPGPLAPSASAPGPQSNPLKREWIRFLPRPYSIDQLLDLAVQMLPQPRLETA